MSVVRVASINRARARARAIVWTAAALVAIALLALPFVGHGATTTVAIRDFSFQPSRVTIAVGDTVTWTNYDTATHTATSYGNWDTGSITFGSSRSITFTSAGTYDYFCLLHSIMFASVVAGAPGAASTATVAPAPPSVAPASPAATATVEPSVAVVAFPFPTEAATPLRPPHTAGPGPMIVAGAAMAMVALGAFAWLVARQI